MADTELCHYVATRDANRCDPGPAFMSKAFVKETESDADTDEADDGPSLPAGFKNYMTPESFAALLDELRQLRRVERPKVVEIVSWAAGNGDRSENGDYIYGKKRLREIDRRTRYLNKRLDSAVVVDPLQQKNRKQVFFGATVTYADSRDAEHTVKIVGIDEANLEKGLISWLSPVAKALMKASRGDVIKLHTPRGEETLEIIDIAYPAA
jgi:transcription elongation factor GreB